MYIAHTHIHTYVRTYIHTYIHTHTHRQTDRRTDRQTYIHMHICAVRLPCGVIDSTRVKGKAKGKDGTEEGRRRSKNKQGNPQGGDIEDGRKSKKSAKKKEKQKPGENASKTHWIKNTRRKNIPIFPCFWESFPCKLTSHMHTVRCHSVLPWKYHAPTRPGLIQTGASGT